MGRKCAHVKEITELIVECRSRGKGGLKCCTVDRTELASHERPSDMDNKFFITQNKYNVYLLLRTCKLNYNAHKILHIYMHYFFSNTKSVFALKKAFSRTQTASDFDTSL